MNHMPRDDAQIEQVPPEDDLSSRAQIIRRLIKTRAMLQESRNRSAELQDALERFKYQQSKIGER